MDQSPHKPVHIIGGGLAGSEATWQLAKVGIPVVLHEMRPVRKTDAHETEDFAELVCSNSFRSDDAEYNAVGVLHEEMRKLDSLIIKAADLHKVPAGGALAVDRDAFSAEVTKTLENHPLVTIKREEITSLPSSDWDSVIIATGPLTTPTLSEAITKLTGDDSLAFFDAIAPIIYRESINLDVAWFQSRYDKGDSSDYINLPMDREQYDAFIDALIEGEKTVFKEWEENTPYFDGCLPIEIMAERGRETLSFGPMKPVGLTNPHNPTVKPHAIIQLRQDNALATLWNIVGFQTKLTHSEQKRIFRTIPGLENAEFARLGGLHRNTFLNGPRLLDETLKLKAAPHIRFAGQITGCEGYVESAATGLLTGIFTAHERLGKSFSTPPATTSMGALLSHITGGANPETYQPMNINFGLFPPLEDKEKRNEHGKYVKGRERKRIMALRAATDMKSWMDSFE